MIFTVNNVRQIAMFGAVGLVSTLTHYVVALLTSVLVGIFTANFVGFCVAFFVSYFGHSWMTFELTPDERQHISRLPRFLVTAIIGFLLSHTILLLLHEGSDFQNWASLAVAIVTIPVFTFLAARLWVFRT